MSLRAVGTNGRTFNNPTFTGIASFADGSAAAPSITFSSQTNMGLWRGASGTLVYSVASNNYLAFSTTGLVISSLATGLQFGSSGTGSPDVTIARLGAGSGGMSAGRFSYKQGAAVASASQLTLGTDGNYYQITGTTGITLLDNTGWQGGSVVTLKFNGALTVSHNTAASGNFKPIILNGAVGFTTAASNTLTLRYDSTDSAWYEMSRKV